MAKFQFFLPTNLTRIQQRAVDHQGAVFVSGVAGTGKTVVSIKRLQLSSNAILFTYGKLLKKTIIEKLNDPLKKVDNMHNWAFNEIQENKSDKLYLEDFFSDENKTETIELIKSNIGSFDEILVDEGQDLSIQTYKILKEITLKLSVSADNAQQINNKEEATTEEEILQLLPNLRRFELDEIFRCTYEIYNFSRQFVPYNERANNENMLEKLKRKNSGGDKPFVYIEPSINSLYATMMDILDDNITDNIGVLFGKIMPLEQFVKKFQDDYDLSFYRNKIEIPTELKNIIFTTFKSAKGIEFDVVIIPYFDDDANIALEEFYVGSTRAKSQVHILSIGKIPQVIGNFDTTTYELIDQRGL